MEKRKTKKIELVRYVLFCAGAVAIAMLCISHSGCQITTEGIKVLDAAESPEITSVRTLDEKSLEVQFSKAVKAKSATVSKLEAGSTASLEQISHDAMEACPEILDDGKTIVYEFAQATKVGERYQLFGEIADSRGNTLTFALPFDGYNSRVPILIIEEVQGAYIKPKCEYIVLIALTDGNLGGLEFYSAQYPFLSNYQIPSCEVKAGEKIMFHLRTFADVDFENETDGNLAKDKGQWSKPQVRDLFFENSKKCIEPSYGVILLRNKSNMKILDAILYTTEAKKEKFASLSKSAELAVNQGKWISDSQEDFAPYIMEKGDLTTSGRGLRRKDSAGLLNLVKEGKLTQDEIHSSKNDWDIGPTLYSSSR